MPGGAYIAYRLLRIEKIYFPGVGYPPHGVM